MTARDIAELAAGGTLVSVVVPMYNEEDGIDRFFARLEPVLEQVTAPFCARYEIICVDDGSSDTTAARLLGHHKRNPAVKLVALSRNFGKDIALSAGLDLAQGAAIIPIDADLQDPPELIADMFDRWAQGYDMVYGTRIARDGDGYVKRLTASAFYRVFNRLAEVDIPADTGDFRLMDRCVLQAIQKLPERNRFMKGIFSWVGFRQTSVPYRRENREAGTSKWRYWRLWNFALDGITSSSTLPLRIWSYVGAAISLLAFAYAIFLICRTLYFGVDVPGYASLMVVMLFFGGLNLLTMGIMGEYLGRTYTEVKGRPLYLVRELHGFGPDGYPEAGPIGLAGNVKLETLSRRA